MVIKNSLKAFLIQIVTHLWRVRIGRKHVFWIR